MTSPFYDTDAMPNLLFEAKALLCEMEGVSGPYEQVRAVNRLSQAVARFEESERISHERIAMVRKLRDQFGTGLHEGIQLLGKADWDYEAAVEAFKLASAFPPADDNPDEADATWGSD